MFLFAQSCREKNKSFDFSLFVEKGLANDDNKKFLTYINVHGGYFSGMDFVCDMYIRDLKPYLDSPNHDILFLIDAPKKDSLAVKNALKEWCFDSYIITYTTPDFFKLHRQQNVKGISYLFDKNGVKIGLTNPSFKNFHELMRK